MNSEIQLKLVVLGMASVGKTSIINRYLKKEFGHTDVTIMAGFNKQKLTINGKLIDFQIWDTAGQEKYRALIPLYYKDANIALLVYDISDPDSFEQLKIWSKEVMENGPENILMIIIGNKIDLEEKVPYIDVKNYAQEIKAILKFTSAKENLGVEELFYEILEDHFSKNIEQNDELESKKGGSKINQVQKSDQKYWLWNFCNIQ
jgi:small GTP-binding protein